MLGVSTLKYEYTPDGKKKKKYAWIEMIHVACEVALTVTVA
jgi:hypothetical protein